VRPRSFPEGARVNLVDDFELNEILWRSIKGADAPVPPTGRRVIANRQVSR
jgi:hypothetical protein